MRPELALNLGYACWDPPWPGFQLLPGVGARWGRDQGAEETIRGRVQRWAWREMGQGQGQEWDIDRTGVDASREGHR